MPRIRSGYPSVGHLNNKYLQVSNNLSDLDNISTARSNLGISAANTPTTDVGGYYASAEVEGVLQEIGSTLNAHTTDTTIHFTQTSISITESQISDFGDYVLVAGDTMTGTLEIDGGDLDIVDADYGIKVDGEYVFKTYGTENFLLGQSAGLNLYNNSQTGQRNVLVGRQSGKSLTSGSFNAGVGEATFFNLTTGSNSMAFGYRALFSNQTGSFSVAIGSQSCFTGTAVTRTTAIGYYSGRDSGASDCNYFGARAGQNNSRDDTLFVANSNTTTPLIYGEFDTPLVTIHGEFLVKPDTSNTMFEVVDDEIGFYGTATTAQATTGISASTFAANTSGISDDTATYDGYTVGQVVNALRLIGILA